MLTAYHTMLVGGVGPTHFIYPMSILHICFLSVFILFIVTELWINKRNFADKIIQFPKLVRWGVYYLLVFCILLFGDFNNAPTFIYFQF